jgi:hypothetical protein
MKKLTIICSTILSLTFTLQSAQAQTGKYGADLSEEKAIKASNLTKTIQGKEVINVKVVGEIVEVCQMSGCWMTVKTSKDETVRVTFKDYGFFVPKDAAGKTTVFEGEAKMETVDVKTLRHYAEDGGKSKEEIAAITESETKLTFVASGVEIEEK